MHDFLLAKQIFEETLKIVKERKLEKVSAVFLEVGMVSLSHDGMPEHTDDISVENLEFALRSLGRGTALAETEWKIEKIAGNEWKIREISV